MIKDGVIIVRWNSAGGVDKYQTMAKLGETDHTYFAIVTGHEDDPSCGRWFMPGEIVWFDKIDLWEMEQAVFHGDVH